MQHPYLGLLEVLTSSGIPEPRMQHQCRHCDELLNTFHTVVSSDAMATAERAFAGNVEVAHGFVSGKVIRAGDVLVANGVRAGDVEVVTNGFTIKKEKTGDDVEVFTNGFTVKKEKAGHVEVGNSLTTTKEKARNVEVANGFITKEKTGDVASNGFTTKEERAMAGNVEVATNGFVTNNGRLGEVEVVTNSFTTKQEEKADDVVVTNGFTTRQQEKVGDVEVSCNGLITKEERTSDDDAEILHDFSPLLVVYKSGRLERPLILPLVPPGHDPATGVLSKDVPLSGSTFVRLYLPPEATSEDNTTNKKQLPVVVYFHGGGFVVGSAATCVYHRCLNDLASACPAVAVSVDYRLAPEHLLPAAYEDSFAALKWVLAPSDPWLAAHADLTRVFLAGDSAGGNICHHLAMHPDVINAGGVKGIVLIHPWFWGKDPIDGERAHRRSPSSARKMSLWEYVCPDAADGVDDPRMNPTGPNAPGLEGLACERVMVCVAEGDHLRWRGKAYAEAAARAGKQTETVESEGVGHVFYLLDPDMDEAREMLARIAAFVNRSNSVHERAITSECVAATTVKSLRID